MQILLLAAALLVAAGARAEPTMDVLPEMPFKEGDVLSYEQIDKLRNFLPEPFWANREFFFYEGMNLEIGPTQRPYPVSPTYQAATERGGWKATIGRDGSLENWIGGQPFDSKSIDCKGDPHAALKIIWNFKKGWNGSGGDAEWYYSYWDRGEQLPLYYRGLHKVDHARAPRRAAVHPDQGRPVQGGEAALAAAASPCVAPQDARGIMTLNYAYKEEDGPLDKAKNQDTWVWIPDLRRVRRISTAQRTDSVAGTDFTVDDLRSFNGVVPQYEWTCLGEQRVIAPMNVKGLAYPYNDDVQLRPLRLLVRRRPLGGARRLDHPLRSQERGPPLRPQRHLGRQGNVRAAVQRGLRPQERAVEGDLARAPLERGLEDR